MGRPRRAETCPYDQVNVVHCVNRCVRRGYLCGQDPVSGRNFEHRRGWIRARLEFLAGAMAIEVLGYAVMSNHFHVILRNRPDIVEELSDREVALRWWQLCPQRRNEDGSPAEPTEFEHQTQRENIGVGTNHYRTHFAEELAAIRSALGAREPRRGLGAVASRRASFARAGSYRVCESVREG